jgi:hypothetical protein
MKIAIVVLKLVITLIVGQTLFFKFSGAAESVYIFSKLNIEAWGRLTLGALELVSIILLSHVLILGLVIMNDGGELFALALITFLCTVVLLYWKRAEMREIISKLIQA